MSEIRKTVCLPDCTCRECERKHFAAEIEQLRASLARVTAERDAMQAECKRIIIQVEMCVRDDFESGRLVAATEILAAGEAEKEEVGS